MYYLDYDKSNNQFLIKETVTQSVFKVIPKGLMNPDRSEVIHLVKKFKWLNSH